MKAKKMSTDQLIIINDITKTQPEDTIKTHPEDHVLNTCKSLQETSFTNPTYNHFKTSKEASKQFIDKEELNQATFLKLKVRHMITLIQLQNTDNINSNPENSQHYTKG